MKKPMQENFKNSITLTYYHKKKNHYENIKTPLTIIE